MAQSTSGGVFDSGAVSVPSASAWTRILTLSTLSKNTVVGIDVAVAGNPAQLRLTRAAKPGETHGLLQTDMTQVGRYVLLATVKGTGTVNTPNAGDVVALNVNTEGSAEIGVEALATAAGASSVRAYGGVTV